MLQDMDRVQDLIDYYRTQGAPADQQMLAALLREVQEMDGGVLCAERVRHIAACYQIKESILKALIRRVSGLRFEDGPHTLEICSSCKNGRSLIEEIMQEYRVKPGACSETGKFIFQTTGCMKNCKNGPSVKWDGVLYPHSDMKLIRELVRSGIK